MSETADIFSGDQRCHQCHTEVSTDDRFCGECGAPQPKKSTFSILENERNADQTASALSSRQANSPTSANRYFIILVIVGVLIAGLAFLISQHENSQRATSSANQDKPSISNPSTMLENQPPKAGPFPRVFITKPNSTALKCIRGKTVNCSTANGSLKIDEYISNGTVIFETVFEDGNEFQHRYVGRRRDTGAQLRRIENPEPDVSESISFYLINSSVSGEVKNKSIIIVSGGGHCDFRDTKYSMNAELNKTLVTIIRGAARCEDNDGNLHVLSSEQNNLLVWKHW